MTKRSVEKTVFAMLVGCALAIAGAATAAGIRPGRVLVTEFLVDGAAPDLGSRVSRVARQMFRRESLGHSGIRVIRDDEATAAAEGQGSTSAAAGTGTGPAGGAVK